MAWRNSRPLSVVPSINHSTPGSLFHRVLAENPSPVSEILWQILRALALWNGFDRSSNGNSEIPKSFSELLEGVDTSGLRADTAAPVAALVDLMRAAHISSCDIAIACNNVIDWAIDKELANTAEAFSQVAAMVSKDNPATAYNEGRLARHCGDYARAESYFRRAVVLGRRANDSEAIVRSLIAFGTLVRRRGNLKGAMRLYARALALARRHNFRILEADVLQDMGGLCIDAGWFHRAERYFRAAIDLEEPGSSRQTWFAHDLAYLWVEMGHFEEALSVFKAVEIRLREGGWEMVWAGSLGRASGGAGDEDQFERAWTTAKRLGWATDGTPATACTLLDLARGAASLRQWQRAEQAATDALALAERIRDGFYILTAESVLGSVKARNHLNETTVEPVGENSGRPLSDVEEILELLGANQQ